MFFNKWFTRQIFDRYNLPEQERAGQCGQTALSFAHVEPIITPPYDGQAKERLPTLQFAKITHHETPHRPYEIAHLRHCQARRKTVPAGAFPQRGIGE